MDLRSCACISRLEPIRRRTVSNAKPELLTKSQIVTRYERLSFVSMAAHGINDCIQQSLKLSGFQKYFHLLLSSYDAYVNQLGVQKPVSLERLLAFVLGEAVKEARTVLRWKVHLVSDDDLVDRLRTLEYLIFEKDQDPPSVIDVVRWRLCGVLRWMVEQSFVDLSDLARDDRQLRSYEQKALFLGNLDQFNRPIPDSMSVGEFLCCLAVAFDDYQSLHWLFVEKKLLPTTTCHGWNLVHLCAHLGRREIFQFLLSELSDVSALISVSSNRHGTSDLFAVHLAIQSGFVDLADLLIPCGCPLVDKQGKSVAGHAKNSSHRFVREWGVKKEKPLKLEEDIRELFEILTDRATREESVKDFLSKTNCLNFRRWKECHYNFFDKPGPLEKTFLQTIVFCCCSVDSGDHDLVACLIDSFIQARYDSSCRSQDFDHFFGGFTDSSCELLRNASFEMSDDIRLQVIERDERLPWTQCLDGTWASHAKVCYDPRKTIPILVALGEECRSNPMVVEVLKQRGKNLLRLDALLSLEKEAVRELVAIFCQGASVETIVQHETMLHGIASTIEREFYHAVAPDRFNNSLAISPDGKVNLDCSIFGVDYGETRPVRKTRLFHSEKRLDLERLWVVLLVEGYDHLIEWSMDPERTMWTAEKEQAAFRTAAFFGHDAIVRLFLFPSSHLSASLSSDRLELLKAACFGAAEAGHLAALVGLLDEYRYMAVEGSLNDIPLQPSALSDEDSHTLVGSALFGVLNSIDGFTPLLAETMPAIEILLWLFITTSIDPKTVFDAMVLDSTLHDDIHYLQPFTRLFEFLVKQRHLDIWTCQTEAQKLSEKYVEKADLADGN
jgi:hypothetical protein